MLRRILGAGALLVAAAAAVWAVREWTRPGPVTVATARVDVGRVEATVANTRAGSVEACRRAKLAPPAAGRIERLAVREGERVRAGQVLLELWNEDYVARERVAREQLAAARERAREACLAAEVSGREAARAHRLAERGFVSAERVDRAEGEAAVRAASCEGARVQVAEAEARLQAARADTARTVLRAPFAGVVAKVNGEVGEYLTPSPPGIPTLPAVDLVDDSCLYVSAPIDEADATQVRVGMPARITLDAFRGRSFAARVRRVAPYVLALEKQARTVEIEVQFDDPAQAHPLLVGYSADVEVQVAVREAVLRVPTGAVMPGGRVLVLAPPGRLEERRIEPGLYNWEYTEVREGLAAGEQVVVSLERAGVRAGAAAVADDPAAR